MPKKNTTTTTSSTAAAAAPVETVTYASKQELLTVNCPEEDYELPDGKVVRIRSLTRQESHEVAGAKQSAKMEQHAVSHALVEPKLGIRDVEAWMMQVGYGYLEGLVDRILTISGMQDNAHKEAVKRFPDEPPEK